MLGELEKIPLAHSESVLVPTVGTKVDDLEGSKLRIHNPVRLSPQRVLPASFGIRGAHAFWLKRQFTAGALHGVRR